MDYSLKRMTLYRSLVFLSLLLCIPFFSWGERKAPKKKQPPSEETEEEIFLPSLTDSLADSKKLKNRLLRELADDHNIDPKNQTTEENPEGKTETNKNGKTVKFKDMELQVIGRHTEEIIYKKSKRDVSSEKE